MKKETDELGLAAVYLSRALKEEGCPICRRVRESEERWIWTVLYELTGDPELYEKFAGSLGLCREHAALMAQQVVETRELNYPDLRGPALRNRGFPGSSGSSAAKSRALPSL